MHKLLMAIRHKFTGIDAVAAGLFCSLLTALVWQHWAAPPFSPDSWSYFELSTTVFDDFFRFTTWRSYQLSQPYSTAFPLLWPTLIALWNAIFDSGINAGVYLNVFIAGCSAWVLGEITQRWCQQRAWGYLTAIALLSHSAYVDELMAARSIPLAMLLWMIIIAMFLNTTRLRHTASLALIAGLAVLTRFDFLLAAIALGGISAWRHRPQLWTAAGLYYSVLLLILLPWALYSWQHFGQLWMSDNVRTVLSANRTFVLDYFPQPPPSLWEQPLTWLSKQYRNIHIVGQAGLSSLLQAWPMWLGLIINAGILLRQRWLPPHTTKPIYWPYLLLLLVPIVIISSVTLTGYKDQRYFTPLWLWLYLGLFAALGNILATPAKKRIALLLASVIVTGALIQQILLPPRNTTPGTRNISPYAHLANCMQHEAQITATPPRLLFLTPAHVNTFKFGALSKITTVIKPSNLTATTLSAFVQDYGVTHILSNDLAAYQAELLHPQRVTACDAPLFRLP